MVLVLVIRLVARPVLVAVVGERLIVVPSLAHLHYNLRLHLGLGPAIAAEVRLGLQLGLLLQLLLDVLQRSEYVGLAGKQAAPGPLHIA